MNLAQRVVAFSVKAEMKPGNTSSWPVICVSLDKHCVNHFGDFDGQSKYTGTRFDDGSAISVDPETNLPIEYLGVFAAEWEPDNA